MAEEKVEKFGPTNGRFAGGLGLAAVVATAVATVVDGRHSSDLLVFVLLGLASVLIWMVMLRPAVYTDGEDLVMRSIATTTTVPLRVIDKVTVGAMLMVKCGDRVYRSIAVQRSRQRARTSEARTFASARGGGHQHTVFETGGGSDPVRNYSDFIEVRLEHLAKEARETHRRTPAAPAGSAAASVESSSTGSSSAGSSSPGSSPAGSAGDPGVRTSWAWPELVAAVVLAAVAIVLILL
jgi:hypothetical protein